MIHPKLKDEKVIVDGNGDEPIETLIKKVDNYEKAESFSGARHHA